MAGSLPDCVLVYTARNYRLANRGQVTDRFIKALERLGSGEMYVRVGGIHALAHVLRDSRDHHADVLQVLVAFVRHHTLLTTTDETSSGIRSEPPAEPAPDVQAALTAIVTRPVRPDHEPAGTLHLAGLHLAGAQLPGALLRGADLTGSALQDAQVMGAQLQKADLRGTRLRKTKLHGARLDDAILKGADLWHARLATADGLNPATGLTIAQLAIASIDRYTYLPKGMRDDLDTWLEQNR